MDFDERYRVIQTRDARFDGQFYTAVHTTGIYCRPSCPARTPLPGNVSFFATSAAAHEAGFRACKRCIPDATPGAPDWNLRDDLVGRAMRLITDGVVDREGVPGLAARLGYSSRHLTRMLTEQLGAGPLALSRAHRAQTARALLTSTAMPMSDVAWASGFTSVRQFNETIAEVFEQTPGALRARGAAAHGAPGTVTLLLPARPPFDAGGVFRWLAARAVDGVESASADHYARTVALPHGTGRFEVTASPAGLRLVARLADLRDLPALVARVRRLFDLDSDPVGIDQALSADPILARLVRATPGIRLPGTVDPAEMLFRAIIGQQISVAAARTQLSRLAVAAGDELPGDPAPTRLFPTPAAIVERGRDALVGPRARIDTVLQTAEALASGELRIGFGDDASDQHAALVARRGIGDWTAGYVSMRVLGRPDVVLTGDVALRAGARRIGFANGIPDLVQRAATLAPWRSYLSLHLWAAAAARPAALSSTTPEAP